MKRSTTGMIVRRILRNRGLFSLLFVAGAAFLLSGCARKDPYTELNRSMQMQKMREKLAEKMKQYGKSSSRRIQAMEKTLQKNRRTISQLKKENRQLRNSVRELQKRLKRAGEDATIDLPEQTEETGPTGTGTDSAASGTDGEDSTWESLYTRGDNKTKNDGTSNERAANKESGGRVKQNLPSSEYGKPLSKNIKERLEEYYSEIGTGEETTSSSSEKPGNKKKTSIGTEKNTKSDGKETSGSDRLTREQKDRIWAHLGTESPNMEKIANEVKPHLDRISAWLVGGLFDSNLYRRRNVEKLILSLGSDHFRSHVLNRLKQDDAPVQLIRLAGDLHLERARDPLKKFLNDSDSDTVYYTRRALVQTGHRKSIPYLMEYLAGKEVDQLFKMDSHDILKTATGKSFGYPNAIIAEEKENEMKQKEWKQWWRKNGPYLYWNSKNDRYKLNRKARSAKQEVDPLTGKQRNKSTSRNK